MLKEIDRFHCVYQIDDDVNVDKYYHRPALFALHREIEYSLDKIEEILDAIKGKPAAGSVWIAEDLMVTWVKTVGNIVYMFLVKYANAEVP